LRAGWTVTLLLHQEKGRVAQVISILCVFLVFFVASAQASHVHPDSAHHDCSICSIAHAGALATVGFETTPATRPAVIENPPETLAASSQPSAAHFIRPPPSVWIAS